MVILVEMSEVSLSQTAQFGRAFWENDGAHTPPHPLLIFSNTLF